MVQECSCGKSIIDIAIIGAGPAGLSAALYAARSGLHTVVFGEPYAGSLAKAGVIENFPTMIGSPSGIEVIDRMLQQASDFGAEIQEVKIKQIVRETCDSQTLFTLYLEDGSSLCAHAVVLATGTKHRKLGLEGEEEFLNRGVGYCTLCDGPLYRDQQVAIVGFGDESVVAALRMATIASEVHLVGSKTRIGANPELIDELQKHDNVTIYEKTKLLRIIGDANGVTGLQIKENKFEQELDVRAVFIEVGVLPSSAIALGVGIELDGNFIRVTLEGETNVPGFFAAGDITGGRTRQAIISAGDGARAAISAIDHLKKLGVGSSKLKTTQWGGSKREKPKKKEEVISANALHDYILADEGFTAAFNRYNADVEKISQFNEKMGRGKMVVVSAHWCPDCRRNVPRMAKISEHLGEWDVVVEDRDAEGVREKYNVRKIPTFILYDEQENEIARIIESPKGKSLEADLLQIANGSY